MGRGFFLRKRDLTDSEHILFGSPLNNFQQYAHLYWVEMDVASSVVAEGKGNKSMMSKWIFNIQNRGVLKRVFNARSNGVTYRPNG